MDDITNGAVYHGYVKEGKAFGRSFTVKNQPALDYVFKLLTGQIKSWQKEDITSGTVDIRIADVGCGLGISAVYIFSNLADFYQSKKWEFLKPLEFDLCDVNEEHQPALSALVTLVNMAYPQYFKVNTFVQVVTNSFPHKNHYKILLYLNVMHYIPSTKWPLALNNIRETMRFNGMMLLMADHYGAAANGNQAREQKLLSVGSRTLFYQPSATLYSPKWGTDNGTKVLNFADTGLFEKNGCVRGGTYEKENLSAEAVSSLLKSHMNVCSKNTICLVDSNGNRVETKLPQIMKRYNSGELILETGSYNFDHESLERAIFSVLDTTQPGFRKLSLNWINSDEYIYAFAGITLMKVKDLISTQPTTQKERDG